MLLKMRSPSHVPLISKEGIHPQAREEDKEANCKRAEPVVFRQISPAVWLRHPSNFWRIISSFSGGITEALTSGGASAMALCPIFPSAAFNSPNSAL